jgi:hypothetical protein
MVFEKKHMQNRRKFISAVIRGGIFTSLGVLSGVLIRRWSEADGCRENFICGTCDLSNQCRLPEADRYRLDQARFNITSASDGRTGK